MDVVSKLDCGDKAAHWVGVNVVMTSREMIVV
jgi:hypothetical protein